ncbi:hypothetical protein ZWY2020_010758 [Hordeum vulgare]|nr:hypothetical protein ZWY2020_010758 [Hordeum vulgare]
MEMLLLPSRATVSRRLLPTAPVCRASAATFRPAASPSNVEATTDATATTSVAKTGQEWGAGGRQGQMSFRLGPDLSEEMRRGMMWRMLAFKARGRCGGLVGARQWRVGRVQARLLGSR